MIAAWPTINALINQVIDRSPALRRGWVSIDVLHIGNFSKASYLTPFIILVTVD